jgi:tryptophanyl-tRNA synthetase
VVVSVLVLVGLLTNLPPFTWGVRVQRVFSGMQPTGAVHLGNYVGALKNWVGMQDEYDCIYTVVGFHAITVPVDPEILRAQRLYLAKAVMAVGVDPDKSLFYYQSAVPQHLELSWYLGIDTPLGALNRMTQFKEKSEKVGERLGLYSYPVLQAADILIHKANAVPVGDDQTQHLELTRDIAQRFNGRYGETFPVPERITPKVGGRVKSDPNPNGVVGLFDEPDVLMKKFKRAVTDSGSSVHMDWKEKPGISNLLEIMSVVTDRAIDALVDEFAGQQYGHLKVAVGEAAVEAFTPFRNRFDSFDEGEVEEVMVRNAARAREMAEETLVEVRHKMGL